MKFVEKFKVVKLGHSDQGISKILKKELEDYDYDGYVDFCVAPVCEYDLKNHLVINARTDNSEDEFYIFRDGNLIRLGEEIKFLQMATFKFKKGYHLQEFFDQYSKSIGMVFYVSPDNPNTIFHAGNLIRVAILKHEIILDTKKVVTL